MQSSPLKPAKLFIWDLDNVLYPVDEKYKQALRAAIDVVVAKQKKKEGEQEELPPPKP